jgi:hypothetical protein
MMTAVLLVLADLRAVRGLRGALFARFFTVVFHSGSSHKRTLADVFNCKGNTDLMFST